MTRSSKGEESDGDIGFNASFKSATPLMDEGDVEDAAGAADPSSKDHQRSTSPSRWSRQTERRELTPGMIRARRISCCVFVLALVITLIAVLATSFKKVDNTEYGLKYAKYSKILNDASQSGGLHAGPPGFKFIKFPSTFVTADQEGACISRDGLRVEFSVTFQYLIKQENLYDAVIRYRDFGKWANIVEAAGQSSVQHSCSEFFISNFQNKRGEIQSTMEANLRSKLGGDPQDPNDFGVFAEAISLQLRNVELPIEYDDAISKKQSAEEDIELARTQRKQEITKARTEFLAAEQEAQRILDIAETEANVLITEANLKAQETLFAFEKEAETLVSVKESLNLTTTGVLAYTTNKMLEDVETLSISAGEPAALSRKDEL